LGSSNGTFLNGKRVTQPAPLTDTDQIEIGQFRLVFRQSSRPKRKQDGEAGSEKTIVDLRL
jgi:pSer/pThr/pTyr-binding forkhead associated (FHA) protein